MNLTPLNIKLRGRLILSYLFIITIITGGLLFYVWLAPNDAIVNSPQFFNRRQAANYTTLLAQLYADQNSWANASDYTQALINPYPITDAPLIGPIAQIDFKDIFIIQRAILTDAQYLVLSDTSNQLPPNTPLPADLKAFSVPITHENQTVGHLNIFIPFGENLLETLRFTISRLLTTVVLWATAIALIFALALAQQLSRPLRSLDTAARALAAGESLTPLPVTSQDEIGSLTNSFNEMAHALQQQKQLRQQLVADIAHELRTPLAVMQLELEALEDGIQSAAQATPTLKRKITTLERLITDLRTLSLADAQELQLELTPLNPTPFLTALTQSWQTQATAANITLTLSLQSTTLPTILADEQRFYQIFHNLISNALRYTPPNGRIEIGGRDDDHTLTLWVTDTGTGIPTDQLPHIFNRFYRADKSRSRETGGSGLGLAITKRLVTLHHGHITAASIPNQTTTFTLTFPTTSYQH